MILDASMSDSDHVVLFDDETREIAREIVRCGGLDGQWLGQVQAYEQTVLRERV